VIVFLDVDGTYAHDGVPPAAHVRAVRAARARGHRVLLCTGRPLSMLHPPLLDAGFDGVVASAGAYVEVGGTVLRDERFPAALAARTVRLLDAHGAAYVLETPEALLGPPDAPQRARRVAARLRPGGAAEERPAFLHGMRTAPDLTAVRFSKVTVLDCATPVVDLGAALGPEVATITSSIPGMGGGSGEIYLAHLHKALGAQLAAAHLGEGAATAVAVGDGRNDVEVIAWAGTGVAVEGSPAEVLAVADRVTPGPERDGIAVLLQDLGLV
jgi:hydroxymethylpyrimidine pyrophosphatase-like HAD family hydrolase